MNNKKQYFTARFKKSVVYLIFIFISVLIISTIVGPPKYYIAPIVSIILAHLILEWWKYRDWKKTSHL